MLGDDRQRTYPAYEGNPLYFGALRHRWRRPCTSSGSRSIATRCWKARCGGGYERLSGRCARNSASRSYPAFCRENMSICSWKSRRILRSATSCGASELRARSWMCQQRSRAIRSLVKAGGAERHAPQGAKLVEVERPHAVDLGLDSLAIERWATADAGKDSRPTEGLVTESQVRPSCKTSGLLRRGGRAT
jgi:hypothetical protein